MGEGARRREGRGGGGGEGGSNLPPMNTPAFLNVVAHGCGLLNEPWSSVAPVAATSAAALDSFMPAPGSTTV